MKAFGVFLCSAFVLAPLMVAQAADSGAAVSGAAAPASDPAIESIQREIDESGYHWTAKRNWTTDLSEDEKAALLGYADPPGAEKRFAALDPRDFPVARDLPDSFSWRTLGGVTPVKDQDGCGSCWDFAAIGALEAVLRINEGVVYDLSEQQILSCATPGYGCDGGSHWTVWGYLRDHGAVTEACMPYGASDAIPCDDGACERVATTSGWVDIPNDVEAIKTQVLIAPVASSFHVYSDFYSYGSGCYQHPGTEATNHVVVIVGWNDNMCGGGGAWLCKNSWGTGWGDLGGYFWIRYGTCQIGTRAARVLYDPGDAIVYAARSASDAGGDGDGFPDPGESVLLSVALRGEVVADSHDDVVATLSSTSPLLAVAAGAVTYGSLDAAETAWGAAPYEVEVSEFVPVGATAECVLSIEADGGAFTCADTFDLVLGTTPVLLVDDDEGQATDAYFAAALDSRGIAFSTWDVLADGEPASSDLGRYDAVVWDCGLLGGLSAGDRAAVSGHLDAGGALLVSGQDVGFWLVQPQNPEEIAFLNEYLHADYLADDPGMRSVSGAPGDPLGDGLVFSLNGDGSAQNQFWPDLIAPAAGAVTSFEYGDYGMGFAGAVRSEVAHRLVFFGFGIEGITGASRQATVLGRSLDWLVGGVWPDTERPVVDACETGNTLTLPGGADHTVRWLASDNVGVESVDVLASWDGGATFPVIVASGEPDDGVFAWTVPDTACQALRFRVVARDAAGLASYDDSDVYCVTTAAATAGAEDGAADAGPLALSQNVPNPFNPRTSIAYSVPRTCFVSLRIYDTAGRLVRALVEGSAAAGRRTAVWDGLDADGRPVASGVYLCRLLADGREETRKMVLLR